MICSFCRRTLLSRLSSKPCSTATPIRHTSSLAPSTTPFSGQPPPSISLQPQKTSPSAISSNTPGISQPLSTPMLPSTAGASKPDTKPKHVKKQQLKLVGSIPGGTPLQGLGYLKAKPIVLAKEDDEYPEWLWTLLDAGPGAKGKEGRMSAADVAALPRSTREKYLKKQEKLLKTLPKKIPIHEQSKDLTQLGDSVEVSMGRRQELVKSLRGARRKSIKEENFLRGL